MRRSYLSIWIIIVVFAVLQTVGGAVYLALSVQKENAYTYVECKIEEIISEPSEAEEGTYVVKSITVSYTNEKGESVLAKMSDYPQSFQEGSTFVGRYLTNPLEISAKSKDLSLQCFTLCLGIVYSVVAVLLFVYRKKLGLYALEDVRKDNLEEDAETSDEENDEENNDIYRKEISE